MFHLLIYNHVVLHPEKKMSHFKKYWSRPLQADVLELLEAKVRSSHIFTIFLPSDVSHSLLRGTIVSTPSPPCILIPRPLKRNPASMVCFSTSKPIPTMKVMARMPLTPSTRGRLSTSDTLILLRQCPLTWILLSGGGYVISFLSCF